MTSKQKSIIIFFNCNNSWSMITYKKRIWIVSGSTRIKHYTFTYFTSQSILSVNQNSFSYQTRGLQRILIGTSKTILPLFFILKPRVPRPFNLCVWIKVRFSKGVQNPGPFRRLHYVYCSSLYMFLTLLTHLDTYDFSLWRTKEGYESRVLQPLV